MSVFLLHSRTAWNDHFPETTKTNLNSQTSTSRQTLTSTGIHVSNCLFKSISSTSDGGALHCTSFTYLLVESSSFFSCSTSAQYGGAIYFSNGNGQCVLYEVCGYDCYSTHTSDSNYQFAFIEVNNGTSSKNNVNYSSIARCVNVNSNSYRILGLSNGKIYCSSINSSINKCQLYAAISCWPTNDSNSVACSLVYSTFSDNRATVSICIVLNTKGANFEMKSCNILRNTQGTVGREGTFYIGGNLNVYDSCILENTATYVFHQYPSSYAVTLSNCTVDKTSSNGYLTTQNTVTKSFIHALKHMSNLICHAEYDTAGTLTPIIQTPSKKQKYLFSCGKCFNQPQLSDFFSFHSIFLFNFIHAGATLS
jgi:hypothetical protein